MIGKRLLVVEDEIIVANSIQRTLEKMGYIVPATASSGEEAVQITAEKRPDLVLMDIKLPGDMDGVKATEQIHARFDIPVVYLTAYADEETLQRAKITEPFGYVLKPFQARELRSSGKKAEGERAALQGRIRDRTGPHFHEGPRPTLYACQ